MKKSTIHRRISSEGSNSYQFLDKMEQNSKKSNSFQSKSLQSEIIFPNKKHSTSPPIQLHSKEGEKEEKKEIDLEKEVNTLLQEIQSWKTSEFLYSKKEKFLLKTVSLQGKLLFEKSLTLCKLEIKIQRLIHLIRRNVHQDLDPFKASLMNKCLELEKRENNRLKKKKKKSFQTLTWSLRNGLIEFEDSKISKISESETASEKDLSSGEIDICESCPEEEEKEVLAEKKVIKAEHRVQPKTVQDLKKEKLVLIEDPKTPLSIPLRWSNFSI